MSPERSYGADESRWPETGTEQSNRMQVLEPLAIGYVCLPARNVFHVLCVDQIDLESPRFEDLLDRNPVHAGRLHRDRMNPALLQPVGKGLQIASESGKAADGAGVSVSAHGDVQLAGANINASSIRMQDRQRITSSLTLLGHLLLRSCRSDARGADTEQTPNRDRRRKTGSRHHTSVRNPRPTLIGRASNRAPMSARAVAVIRPAANIIARLAFLYILCGPASCTLGRTDPKIRAPVRPIASRESIMREPEPPASGGAGVGVKIVDPGCRVVHI
jgi:hypothetical protein